MDNSFDESAYGGTVVDENGDMVAGASITVAQYDNPDGSQSRSSSTSQKRIAVTDSDGRFRIGAAQSYDDWNCVVMVDAGDRVGFGLLRPGVDGTVALLPATSVQLRIIDSFGNPVPEVLVSPRDLIVNAHHYMLYSACPERWQAPTRADGSVEWLGVPRGCRIAVEIQDARYARKQFSFETALTPGPFDHTVELSPGGEIVGRVVLTTNGEPAAGLKIHASGSIEGQSYFQTAETTTDDHGNYRFCRLTPARYGISVVSYGGFSNEWTSLPLNHIDVSDHQTCAAPDIVLIRAGFIRGSVTYIGSGKPAPHVSVGISDPEYHWYTSYGTGTDGTFRAVLPPGEKYTVRAGNHDNGRVVSVAEGTETIVDLAVHEPRQSEPWPTTTVSGRVLGLDHQPVADVVVTAEFLTKREPLYCVTSSRGRFQFEQIERDLADAHLFAVHGRLAAYQVIATDGVPVDLTLSYNLLGSITGKIVDTNGRPISAADVNLVWYGSGGGVGRYIKTVQTDAYGCYLIDPIFVECEYKLAISADGYHDRDAIFRRLMPGQTRKKRPIVLKRSMPVSGTVMDANGVPVDEADILAVGCPVTRTDSEGRFVLDAHEGPVSISVYIGREERLSTQVEGGQTDLVFRLPTD